MQYTSLPWGITLYCKVLCSVFKSMVRSVKSAWETESYNAFSRSADTVQHIMHTSKQGPVSKTTINEVQMELDLYTRTFSYEFIGRNERHQMEHEDIPNLHCLPKISHMITYTWTRWARVDSIGRTTKSLTRFVTYRSRGRQTFSNVEMR